MIRPIPKRPNITFHPALRDDGRWAIELKDGERSYGFLHWIENDNGNICRSSNKNICKSFHCEEETLGLCEQLNEMYAEGAIG